MVLPVCGGWGGTDVNACPFQKKVHIWQKNAERCLFDPKGRGVKSYMGNVKIAGPLFIKGLPL